MKNTFLLVFILWDCCVLTAQISVYDSAFHKAYCDGDMSRWEQLLDAMKSEPSSHSNHDEYAILRTQYALIGYFVGVGDKKRAKGELKEAENRLAYLRKEWGDDPRLLALKGAFLAFQMGLNTWKVVILGPQSVRNLKEAFEKGKDFPEVWVEWGNMKFHAPSIGGGDKKEALAAYKMALHKMDSLGAPFPKHWFYLSTKVNYGRTLLELGKEEEALSFFRELKEQEPSFQWVSREILPKLEKGESFQWYSLEFDE